MSLLDGHYEILSEKVLTKQLSVFEVSSSSGERLRIDWYSLQSSEEERAFEEYRQILRALKRQGLGAIENIVARPGAYYVAWYYPPIEEKRVKDSREISQLLEHYNYDVARATILANASAKAEVYGLDFLSHKATVSPSIASSSQNTTQIISTKKPNLTHKVYRHTLLAYAPALILGLLGMLLLLTSLNIYTNKAVIDVPKVIGLEVNSALKVLYDLGFDVALEAVVSSEHYGTVLDVEPNEGTPLRLGRRLNMRYAVNSQSEQTVVMPKLLGLSNLELIKSRLLEAGLELGEVISVSSDIAPDTVIALAWAEGSNVPKGSAIDVIVSAGLAQRQTVMLELRGLSLEEAQDYISLMGLTQEVQIERQSPSPFPVNTVLQQFIAAGRLINPDTAVLRLVVAGDAPLPENAMPDFIGLSQDEAEALAAQLNMRISIETLASTNLIRGVVSQDPAPNDVFSNAVSLMINNPPLVIPSPNINVTVRPPSLRRVNFSWPIEFGIPQQLAEVTMTTLAGEKIVIYRQYVQGGNAVEGSYDTYEPGPLLLKLTLNGYDYGIPIRDTLQ